MFSFLKYHKIHAFFISNIFITNIRLKLVKNQGKAKEHPEAELLLLENYLLTSSSSSSKNDRSYSKKITRNKYVYLNEVIWLMTMKKMLKMKKRSHRYDINRTRPTNGHKYTKHKMCLSIMMVICIKEHPNIWSSIDEKVKQHWGWVEKKSC